MHVYALESPQGLVKIGRSGNPDQRINALASAGGFEPVSVWYSLPVPNAAAIEAAAHSALAEFRELGEWFKTPFGAAVDAVQSLICPAPVQRYWRDAANELMQQRKLKHSDICAQLGVTRGAVSHWLNGRNEPSIDQFCALSRILGTTPNELLGFNDENATATFGARLKSARKKAGLTQLQLATIGEVTESAVCQWERGTIQKQDAAALLKIARALNVSPYWLMFGEQA